MSDFDYFSAELCCPVCRTLSTVALQTEIQPDAHGAFLRVGDRVTLGPRGVAEGDYLTLREPAPGEPVHILHPWECVQCGAENWVEVVLDGTLIVDIAAVALDRITLDRAHYVSIGIEERYRHITGQPLYEQHDTHDSGTALRLRQDWIDLLRAKL